MKSKPLDIEELIKEIYLVKRVVDKIIENNNAIIINGLNITQISNKLTLSRFTVRKYINELLFLNIVNKNEIIRNSIIYSLKVYKEDFNNMNIRRIVNLLKEESVNFIGVTFNQMLCILKESSINNEKLKLLLVFMQMYNLIEFIKIGPLSIYRLKRDLNQTDLSNLIYNFHERFKKKY